MKEAVIIGHAVMGNLSHLCFTPNQMFVLPIYKSNVLTLETESHNFFIDKTAPEQFRNPVHSTFLP